MTEVAAEWLPLKRLAPWPDNPRNNTAAIERVAESIKRFGFGAPIVARRANGQIIAGHTRYEAAKRLGLESVPVRFLDLDAADARLLSLADNKLAEIADWDTNALAQLLPEIDLDDALFAGFSEKEFRELTANEFDGSGASNDIEIDGFAVVVECTNEREQVEVLELCEAKGWKCRALL